MPLLVPTFDLQPGMRLAEALICDGKVMLQGGRKLTRHDIGVLRRRYPGIRMRIDDPVLDSIVEFEDDSRERQVAAESQKQIADAMSDVHSRFKDRASLNNVQVGALRTTVRDAMDYLNANPVSAALVSSCMESKTFLADHAGNVFYLSMLLSYRVLDYVVSERRRQLRARRVRPNFATDLVPLALGTMMMDIGMVPHAHLLGTDRRLTDAESEALRWHPMEGVKLLSEHTSALTRMIVRTHHENYCETGYPKNRSPEKTHVFTRIVRIADAFNAATSDRVFVHAKSPARVLWEMSRGPYRGAFDPVLMKAFCSLIQPFQIGSKLRLSDGRYAAVVRYDRKDPYDPQVIIAFDENNEVLPRDRLEGPLNLSTRPELRIASFDGEDLSFIYDELPVQKVPKRERFDTILDAAYP